MAVTRARKYATRSTLKVKTSPTATKTTKTSKISAVKKGGRKTPARNLVTTVSTRRRGRSGTTEKRTSKFKSTVTGEREDNSDFQLHSSTSGGKWTVVQGRGRKWFLGQCRLCQECKVRYKTALEACKCISKHGLLRCYFCFHLCGTTDELFEHFKIVHGYKGCEGWILCAFCNKHVIYKSVTGHVITAHMSPPDSKELSASTPQGCKKPLQ